MLTEDHHPLAHRRALLAMCVDRTLMSMCAVEPMDRLRPRMYDPTVGRFVSFDAFEGHVDTPASLHKYLYANDDPILYADPSGRESLVSLLVTMGIGIALNVMLFPNVANAPGPRDPIYPDSGGDMVLGAVTSVPVAAGVKLTVKFVVSPAIQWATRGVTRLLTRRPLPVQAVRVYRVISEAEFQHIKQTGQMLAEPSGRSYESGKWFWKDVESVPKWVEKNQEFYKDGYRVVQVDVPPDIMSTAQHHVNLDGVGDAVFIQIEKLTGLAAEEATNE